MYAVVGGMPGYLLQFSDQQNLWSNLRQFVFNRDSYLYQEPDLLLREIRGIPPLCCAFASDCPRSSSGK